MPVASALVLLAAALAEIAGCWLVYAVVRLGWGLAWLAVAAGILLAFGWLLTLVETGGAGRTFAIYGGVYVASSLVWLRVVEAVPVRTSDLLGAALVLAGAAVIYAGIRPT